MNLYTKTSRSMIFCSPGDVAVRRLQPDCVLARGEHVPSHEVWQDSPVPFDHDPQTFIEGFVEERDRVFPCGPDVQGVGIDVFGIAGRAQGYLLLSQKP